jgi:hypothetical protein
MKELEQYKQLLKASEEARPEENKKNDADIYAELSKCVEKFSNPSGVNQYTKSVRKDDNPVLAKANNPLT